MPIISTPNENSVEGMYETSSGKQRVVMTSGFSGTQTAYSESSVECIVQDGSGHKQRCVCVTPIDAGSSLPDQTGQGGKFLKTTGSSLVWDDVLQNKATGSLAVAVEGDADGDGAVAIGMGSEANGQSGIALGTGAESGGDDSICIGGIAKDGGENYNTVIGGRASSTKQGSVVLGYNASSTALGAVALGYQASATENGTFVVGLSTDGNSTTNYTVINSDGKINPSMFANVPSADGTYVLKVTVSGGVKTYSWVAE